MNITNFEDVIEKIQQHLDDYLREHDISPDKNFRCLDPAHEDTHASCGVIPASNRTKWSCFSCGARGDIFDAAGHLEDLPTSGPEYISKTVIPLAQKYGIEVQERELTEEELRRINTYSAYKKAADYISSHATEPAVREMRRRGWEPRYCSERGIGSVDSTMNFINYMVNEGFDHKFLDDIDLTRNNLFAPTNLIFTVHDIHSRPCGFAAKNLLYDPSNKDAGPKYVNTRNVGTDIKCNIYNKSQILYNLYNVKKDTGPIYLFEGYGDVETALQLGLKNVVCIGGTAFTDYHAIELQKIGKTNIIVCLDGDEAGIKDTYKVIDILTKHGQFRLKVVSLPDALDPDDYLREYGVDSFVRNLKQYSAFEWKLNRYPHDTDPAVISEEMIQVIASEPSARYREEMSELLAQKVPYSKNAILDDVNKIINLEEAEMSGKRQRVIQQLTADLNRYPADFRINISRAMGEMEAIDQVFSDEVFSPLVFIKEVTEIKEREEKSNSSLKGFSLGDFTLLEQALNGDWESTLCVVGGSANAGKTSFMAHLALTIALCNIDKDIMVLFQSIDDTVHQFMTRLVCILAYKYYAEMTLNMVKNPIGISSVAAKAREKAYEELIKLINDGRIVVKGGEERGGNTIKFAEDWVKYCKRNYPKRKIVHFLDNFHRVRDFSGIKEERIRFKEMSNAIKDLAKREHIPIWATMEYNKTVGALEPTNNSISESIAMEYDANVIIHLYNELHSRRDEARLFTERETPKGVIKVPTIKALFGKNKITEFKDDLYFDFFTSQSRYEQVSPMVLRDRIESRQLAAKNDTYCKPA